MAKKETIITPSNELVTVKSPRFNKLAIDYPNEGLNDMARKINEIIDYLNEN